MILNAIKVILSAIPILCVTFYFYRFGFVNIAGNLFSIAIISIIALFDVNTYFTKENIKQEEKKLSLSLFTPGKAFSYVNEDKKFDMIMKSVVKDKEKKRKPRNSTLVKKGGEEENLIE